MPEFRVFSRRRTRCARHLSAELEVTDATSSRTPTIPNKLPRPKGELEALEAAGRCRKGWRIITAVNNTVIGYFYVGTAMLFFLLAGILALLMRLQLAVPSNTFLSQETYNQIFTMHGTVMMFLFAVPVVEAMGILLLPQMLGARDLPFPRLGAFAFWAYFVGGLIFFATLFFDLAPSGGWFMYPPLTGTQYSPGIGADFWLLGIGFIEISAIAGAIEIIVGVLRTRAPGMTLDRMPMFAWTMLIFAGMIVFAFPAVILATMLLELERAFGWPFFIAAQGRRCAAVAAPVLVLRPPRGLHHLPAGRRHGVDDRADDGAHAAGRLPADRRRADRDRLLLLRPVGASHVHHRHSGAVAQLLLGGQHGGRDSRAASRCSRGSRRSRPAGCAGDAVAVSCSAFSFIFTLGGLTGVMVAMVPFDWQAHDTYFVVAHLHYVLIGGMVFPLFAAFYYWAPAFSRRALSETLGKMGILADVHRLQRLVLPDAHRRPDGHAAPRLYLSGGDGMGRAEHDLDRRRVLVRGRCAGLPHRSVAQPAPDRHGADRQRLERIVARVDAQPRLRAAQRSAGGEPRSVVGPTEPFGGVEGRPHYLPGTVTGVRETIVTSPIEATPQALLRLPGYGWTPILAAVFTAGFFMLLDRQGDDARADVGRARGRRHPDLDVGERSSAAAARQSATASRCQPTCQDRSRIRGGR